MPTKERPKFPPRFSNIGTFSSAAACTANKKAYLTHTLRSVPAAVPAEEREERVSLTPRKTETLQQEMAVEARHTCS